MLIFAKFMLTVSHNGNPVISNIQRYDIQKKLNTCLNQMLMLQNEQGLQHSL